MTRHGVNQPQAAGAQPSAKELRASMMIIKGHTAAPSRLPRRHHRAEEQRSGPVRIHLGVSRRRSRHR